jgi:hypothetical protein
MVLRMGVGDPQLAAQARQTSIHRARRGLNRALMCRKHHPLEMRRSGINSGGMGGAPATSRAPLDHPH